MKYIENLKTKTAFEIIFIATVVLSFLLWITYICIDGSSSPQFNMFFQRCEDFMADSTNVLGYSAGRDPYHNLLHGLEEKAYPPLTYAIMYLISRVVDVNAIVQKDNNYFYIYNNLQYLTILVIFLILLLLLMYTLIQVTKNGNMAVKTMTALALCCSAPMLYSIERANTIIFTVILCMFFLFYYNSENKVLRELTLIALAIAAAFKMTPALLGIMLLYNKQFKEASRTVIYGIIMVFGPFIFLHGGFSNAPLMFQNMKLNLQAYSSIEGCTLAASLNRFGQTFMNGFILPDMIIAIMKIVTVLTSILLLAVVPFLKFNWEKVAAVVLVLIILPSHSGTYCILYMIPVIVMFLNEEKHRNIDFLYLFCFIMISWDFICPATYIFNFNLAIPIMVIALSITGLINIKKVCWRDYGNK